MVHVVFQYKDKYTGDKWNEQECYVSSVAECKAIYGLGTDCDYKIIKVEEVE